MVAGNRRNNERDEEEREAISAGQSGDIQGMSRPAEADSESVEELVEEGNAFEASIVNGVENAKDPDVSEVTTRQVPEDDVPGGVWKRQRPRCIGASLPKCREVLQPEDETCDKHIQADQENHHVTESARASCRTPQPCGARGCGCRPW
jgi:hypothetical protein